MHYAARGKELREETPLGNEFVEQWRQILEEKETEMERKGQGAELLRQRGHGRE